MDGHRSKRAVHFCLLTVSSPFPSGCFFCVSFRQFISIFRLSSRLNLSNKCLLRITYYQRWEINWLSKDKKNNLRKRNFIGSRTHSNKHTQQFQNQGSEAGGPPVKDQAKLRGQILCLKNTLLYPESFFWENSSQNKIGRYAPRRMGGAGLKLRQ